MVPFAAGIDEEGIADTVPGREELTKPASSTDDRERDGRLDDGVAEEVNACGEVERDGGFTVADGEVESWEE